MTPAEKGAALALYLALMTTECLHLIGARGPVIVEGPFGRNALYLEMLAAATGREVLVSSTATGTSIGAAVLCDPSSVGQVSFTAPEVTADRTLLTAYRDHWRSTAMARTAASV